MINVLNTLKVRPGLAAPLFFSLILVGCASQVTPDSSSAAAPTVTASPAAKAPAPVSAPVAPPAASQESALARAAAAAKAALGAREPSVYFDLDRFDIKPQYQETIIAFANYLQTDPKSRLVIEGHADERGTTEYNLALGQKRAEAVSKALGLLGVPAGRVEAVSFGEEKPRAQGANEEAWAKNRRADLILR